MGAFETSLEAAERLTKTGEGFFSTFLRSATFVQDTTFVELIKKPFAAAAESSLLQSLLDDGIGFIGRDTQLAVALASQGEVGALATLVETFGGSLMFGLTVIDALGTPNKVKLAFNSAIIGAAHAVTLAIIVNPMVALTRKFAPNSDFWPEPENRKKESGKRNRRMQRSRRHG